MNNFFKDILLPSATIFGSLVAFTSVILAFIQYKSIYLRNKKGYINAVFEEIKHNLNIRDCFSNWKTTSNYKMFYKKIKEMDKYSHYPNPTDNQDDVYPLLRTPR